MATNFMHSHPQTVVIGCPHCRQTLRVEARLSGRQLTCPKCRGTLVVPVARPLPSTTAAEGITRPALIAIIIGLLLVIGMIVYLIEGRGAALVLFVLAGAVALFVWKRATISNAISETIARAQARRHEMQELERARAATWQKVAEAKTSSTRDSVPATKSTQPPILNAPRVQTSAPDRQLTPSTPAAASTQRAEPIPPRPVSTTSYASEPNSAAHMSTRNWFGMLGGPQTLSRAGAMLPPAEVEFFGPGTTMLLDRGTLVSPLVYATAAAQHGSFDASLIDGNLPIAPPQSGRVEDLPYWPTYYDASPRQRSRYLDWLVGGRCDPSIELGYVFIYFYGLERRILVDNADHQIVAEEVLRLRANYSTSRSFQRYSSSLLWLIVALSAKQSLLSNAVVEQIFATTDYWDDDSLGRCLAYLYDSGSRLTADWAYLVAKQDRRIQSSVIIRRHEALFRDLFKKRFERQFPAGMELKASKRSRPLAYRPASSTLIQTLGDKLADRFGELPNVLAIESQFKPLIEVWNESVEELRAYDKAHRTHGELSAAAYEALPPELRQGDHPDFDKWFDLWRECVNADGVPIVSLPRLAAVKGIAERRTLLKSQCLEMLQTAACIGIGIEPDSRLLGRNYRWDDVVTLFLLEGEESADAKAYQGASSLLQLGLIVAAADGNIDPDEVKRITQHLEDQFDLSPSQCRRLEALRYLLQHNRPDPAKVFSVLKKRLSDEQRALVGEYLIGIAAADQLITPEENRCLQRIFAALALPKDRLDQLIQPVVTALTVGATAKGSDGASETSFYLDQQAISRIMRDTEAVASILRDAMADTDDDELDTPDAMAVAGVKAVGPTPSPGTWSADRGDNSAAATATMPTAHNDIAQPPLRFRGFFEELVTQAEWPESDAKKLARKHEVMLSGAIEGLNEWSQERWNDWLIEDGDPLRIRLDLLERNNA